MGFIVRCEEAFYDRPENVVQFTCYYEGQVCIIEAVHPAPGVAIIYNQGDLRQFRIQ